MNLLATLEATWPLPRLSTTIDDGIRIAPARDQYKKTQVFGTDELGAIRQTDRHRDLERAPSVYFDCLRPRRRRRNLRNSDRSPWTWPCSDYCDSLLRLRQQLCDDDDDEADETTGVPSRLGLNSSDRDDVVDVVLSGHPGPGFIPSETRLSTLIVAGLDDGKLFEIPSKPLELGSGLLSP